MKLKKKEAGKETTYWFSGLIEVNLQILKIGSANSCIPGELRIRKNFYMGY
jgi:hypothetical protein